MYTIMHHAGPCSNNYTNRFTCILESSGPLMSESHSCLAASVREELLQHPQRLRSNSSAGLERSVSLMFEQLSTSIKRPPHHNNAFRKSTFEHPFWIRGIRSKSKSKRSSKGKQEQAQEQPKGTLNPKPATLNPKPLKP